MYIWLDDDFDWIPKMPIHNTHLPNTATTWQKWFKPRLRMVIIVVNQKSMMMKLPKVLTVYSCIDVILKRDCKYNILILHQYSIKHSKLLLLSFYCLNLGSQKQTRSPNRIFGKKFMIISARKICRLINRRFVTESL